jgi:cytochrome P450
VNPTQTESTSEQTATDGSVDFHAMPPVDGAQPLPADIERIDLSSAEFHDRAYEQYEAMRAKCPVSRAVIVSGDDETDRRGFFNRPLWLVTDYEEGSRALLDRAFTVEAMSVLTEEQKAQMPETPEELKPLMRNILTVDPPEHTRLRKLVQPSFTASAVEKLRPRIQQIADRLLDAAEAAAAERGETAPDRRMELISQFAYPLPVTVISDMLGIPEEDREQTRRWSEQLFAAQTPERQEETRRDIAAFVDYLRQLFTRKRQHPGDDLISELLQVEVEGDRLTEDEVLSMVFVLFIAGHITTVNLIGNGVFALLTHPEQAARLRADLSLAPNAVEEILRFSGPAETTTARFAREDTELGGEAIARGEPLLVVLASADRDPERFHDPNAFDITRADAGRHIAFGKGIHACLGAPLARLEGAVALETLFRRYPDVSLGAPRDEIEWQPSFLRGLKSLPLRF